MTSEKKLESFHQQLLCEFCYKPCATVNERKYLITNHILTKKGSKELQTIKTLLWLCHDCVSQIPKHKILT